MRTHVAVHDRCFTAAGVVLGTLLLAGPCCLVPFPCEASAEQPAEGLAASDDDEPTSGQPASEEPAPSEGVGETQKPDADEPDAPPQAEPVVPAVQSASDKPQTAPQVQYGVGVQLRGIFIPEWLLNMFLDASTPLNSAAFGAEFVRRKGNFDIVGSIDFGFYSPRDGNYLGNGDDPATETDFVHFDGLSALAFAVHFIRHEEILDWLSFVWGGGVGLAVVLGNVFRASSAGCNGDNVDDLSQCHPNFPDYSTKNDAWLKNGDNYGSKSDDSVARPKIFKEDDVPPVVPLIHLLVGFNFKITDYFDVRLDGGFRNAFYVGATGHYFF